jgi:ubiquinone/menaquinone biosynthesis C-methylase UbiE
MWGRRQRSSSWSTRDPANLCSTSGQDPEASRYSRARTGARVTGIDIAEDGIERGRARAAEEDLDVRFDVADALSLPYGDASFDVIVSTFGVIFAPDHRRAAGELARVCRGVGG